jgi:Fur family zinc uptake transcriptional regulator
MIQRSHNAVEARLAAAVQVCHGHGVELTELRRCVLRLILEADVPLTAYQLLDRLRKTRKSAVPPTIYRALDFLLSQGLTHKVERLNAFIPCNRVDHAHSAVQFLICSECGAVVEIADRAVSKLLERAAIRRKFNFVRAAVEIEGVCATCRGLS